MSFDSDNSKLKNSVEYDKNDANKILVIYTQDNKKISSYGSRSPDVKDNKDANGNIFQKNLEMIKQIQDKKSKQKRRYRIEKEERNGRA